jgi:hypothetical protein
MKLILNILAVLIILVGGVWILQGIKVILGSPMTGHSQWVYIGGVVVVIGIGLLAFTNLRKGSLPKK